MLKIKKIFFDFKTELKKDKKSFMWLVYFVIYAMTTFEIFNRPLIGPVGSLKTAIDDKIPFIKEFILPYDTFMPMIVIVGLLLFAYDKKNYKKFMVTLFFAQTASYLIVLFFQTEVPRYDTSLLGNDIFSNMIKITYTLDNNYSGAPSMHVANMVISSIFFAKLDFNRTSKILVIAYMLFVALTTVFVKQHVFLDMPAGIIHAFFSYYVVQYYLKRKEV
ncbi:MAG: phosphatase PAP2 family protein [Tissierellia bacterium]|nr:phosphatase PAP2 family protein [Tissierellia bacterium]